MRAPRDPAVLSAFLGITLVGGLNFVAVKFSNAELAPYWGASARFLVAGALLLVVALVLKWPMPKGPALVGTILYGLLNFAAFYALLYWALLHTTAGFASVVVALAPLITLAFAALHGLERFTLQRAGGALVALVGMAVVFQDQLSVDVPLLALLALLGGAAAGAESSVLIKKFPPAHPMTRNGVAMLLGGALLYALSRLAGETRLIPVQRDTWIALTYLVVVGSMLLFFLFLFVIARWTASATSYAFVLFPIVAVAAGSLLAGERVTWQFLAGTGLVMVGVYVGAIRGHAPAPGPASQPQGPRPS